MKSDCTRRWERDMDEKLLLSEAVSVQADAVDKEA